MKLGVHRGLVPGPLGLLCVSLGSYQELGSRAERLDPLSITTTPSGVPKGRWGPHHCSHIIASINAKSN